MNFLQPKKPKCRGYVANNNKWRLKYVLGATNFWDELITETCSKCVIYIYDSKPCGRWQVERDFYIINKLKKYWSER